MRFRTGILAAVLVTVLGAPLASSAAPRDCVTVQVTGPVIGSKTVAPCVPGGTDAFSVGHNVQSCWAVPPAGASTCATITIWLPV